MSIYDFLGQAALGIGKEYAAQKGLLKTDKDDSRVERWLKQNIQTSLDSKSRFLKGVSKSIEGVVDLGLGIAAGATDIFGADRAKRQLENAIKYNVTEENFGKYEGNYNESWLRGNKVGEFAGNVTEGIGGMVPALATGGTAGMVLTGVSAAGGSTEEALNKDAKLGSALTYGTIMGGMEALTEKIGGFTFGGGSSLLGKATAGTPVGKALSKGAGKFIGDFVSEGAEEVITDLSSPLAKKATGVDNRSLKEQYGEVKEGLGETFLVGGTVGSVISGGQNVLRNSANKERGGARASRADDILNYISEVSQNYKGTDTDVKYDKAINEAFLETERELTQMDENSRKKYLESLDRTPYKLAFDEGGKYIGGVADNVKSSAITKNLKNLSANLKYKAVDNNTEISTDAEDAKSLIEDVLGDRAAVVISDAMDPDTRATYDVDTGIIYVNNNVELDESFSAAVLAIHEITHSTEGTVEYGDLVTTLVTSVSTMEEFRERLKSKGYSAFDEGGLSEKQVEYIARTEIFADLAGHLLSTPSALAKLRARDKGLFGKLKSAIESSRDKTTSREGKRALNKVLKAFNKALNASYGGVKLSDIKDDEEEKENTEQEHGVDNERESKSKSFEKDKYFDSQIQKWESLSHGSYVKVGVLENTHPLCLVGMPSGVLRYDVSKINKNMSKHASYLTVGLLKEIPNIIEHPIAITEFAEYNTVNVFGNVFVNGHPMMIGVTISRDNAGNDISKIRTYNLRRDVEKIITDTNILYLDDNKKRTQEWFLACGKRVPLGGNKFGFIRSISQKSPNVNDNERKSKIPEKNGVTFADLGGNELVNEKDDGSDIIVHPPAPKKSEKKESQATLSKSMLSKYIKDRNDGYIFTVEETKDMIQYVIDQYIRPLNENLKNVHFSTKNREKVYDNLWATLNLLPEGQRTERLFEIADAIIDGVVLVEKSDTEKLVFTEDANEILKRVKPYFHKINLSEIYEDIKKVHGNTAAYALWHNTNGISMNDVKNQLYEEGILIEGSTELDMFIELSEMHRTAKKVIEEAKDIKIKASQFIDSKKRKKMRQSIANELMLAYDYSKRTARAGMREKYETKLAHLEGIIEEEFNSNIYINAVIAKARKFEDIKTGKYQNATKGENDSLKKMVSLMSRMREGNVNKGILRNIMNCLLEWYNPKNEALDNCFDAFTRGQIQICADTMSSNEPLESGDWQLVDEIYGKVYNILQNYTKLYRNGKTIDAEEEVTRQMQILNDAIKNDNSIMKMLRHKGKGKAGKAFNVEQFADPQLMCEVIDGGKQGFAMATLQDFREGNIRCEKTKMNLLQEWNEFIKDKDNKDFIKDLNKNVLIGDVELPLGVAISVYMASKREHAVEALNEYGFLYKNEKGNFTEVKGIFYDEIPLYLSEKAKEYISLLERIYVNCKSVKEEMDILKYGFTSTVEGYYYPISRSIADNIKTKGFIFELDCVSRESFNKRTVEKAKQQLVISDCTTTMLNHAEGISRYYGYSLAIDNFNRAFNLNIGADDNAPDNIKNKLSKHYNDGAVYLKKFVLDAQGKTMEETPGSLFISSLRGTYSKFQLALNPKVLFSQLSSYIAAFNILSFKSLVKGFSLKGKDVDKYCTLAEIRNYNQQVIEAMTVSAKLGKITDKLMEPIAWMDRFTVARLFSACQIEAANKYGLSINSEENKIKAGELLTEVIYKTQQNSFATERSAVMRGSSEIFKTLVMFSADSMKLWGRWIGALAKQHTIRREIYLAKKNKLPIDELQKEYKAAKIQSAKSTATVVTVAMFMASIALMFRHFYNRDDEDEHDAKTFVFDTLGNVIGMFPVMRDIWSYFYDGYELSSFAVDTYNNVFKSLDESLNLVKDAASGKHISNQDCASTLKNTVNAICQVVGVPSRNVFNLIYGSTNLVSKESGYKFDNTFYKQSYASDLKKAIEDDDMDMACTIVSLINSGGKYSSETAEVISNLYGEGYKCLPRTIGDKLTVAGEEYELTGKQYRTINQEYGQATDLINSMVSSADFSKLNSEAQSKAIKFANDYYFAVATEKGLDMNYEEKSSYYKKLVYGKLIDVKVLAMAAARVHQIKEEALEGENVREKIRNYIESLKISANQKYLLFNYFGYTSMVDKDKIKSHIKSNSKLTAEEKEYLLKRYN